MSHGKLEVASTTRRRAWAGVLRGAGILLLSVGSGTLWAADPPAPIEYTAANLADSGMPQTTQGDVKTASDSASGAASAPRSAVIDAVLIIDSSGSMKQTDPRRLRIPAAKMFISLLNAKDRVGLISFSDNGYPVLGLTPADKQNQKKLFAAVEKVSSKGAYTNLSAALKTGHAMLKREGDSQHRRMLVLMSDGKMDTGDFENDKALLNNIRSETIDALVKDGIEVYTIAFTEASDMPLMQELAVRTAALSRLASNDRELHEVFSQIFESAKQPDMLPMDEGAFMVDAAIEEVTVVASKAAPDVQVKLEMPDGRMIVEVNAGKAVRWFNSEQFDMITVDMPPAGQWHLRFSDNRGDKAYVVTKLGMDARVGETPLYAGAEQSAEVWLHNNGDIVTKPEILAQTQFSVEVTQPDGAKIEFPMADAGTDGDRAAGDGVYTNLFKLTQPGQQQVRVIAKSPNFQREKSVIVEVVAATEQVIEAPAPVDPPAVEPKAEPEVQPEVEPPVEPAAAEAAPVKAKEELNIGLILSLFVLVNLVIGAAVGGFFFWRKRKAAKVAAAAADVSDKDDE